MKIDLETGRIAYHAIRFVEGGTDLVQYDFDGNVESITPHTRYNIAEELARRYKEMSWWDRLFYAP